MLLETISNEEKERRMKELEKKREDANESLKGNTIYGYSKKFYFEYAQYTFNTTMNLSRIFPSKHKEGLISDYTKMIKAVQHEKDLKLVKRFMKVDTIDNQVIKVLTLNNKDYKELCEWLNNDGKKLIEDKEKEIKKKSKLSEACIFLNF